MIDLRIVRIRNYGELRQTIDCIVEPHGTNGLDPFEVPLHKVERLVLFTDMVAFSAISDRLPIEHVSGLVSAYLEICSVGIARRGGEVTKLLGDGVMAYFDPDDLDHPFPASCPGLSMMLAMPSVVSQVLSTPSDRARSERRRQAASARAFR